MVGRVGVLSGGGVVTVGEVLLMVGGVVGYPHGTETTW